MRRSMTAGAEGAPWRTKGVVRRLGYSLLPGEAFSYVLHMRPREWPIMAAHTALGALLALSMYGDGVPAPLDRLGAAIVAILIWVLLLNGGTLAINSAFDKDEGDVGYLDAPPPPPRHLAIFGCGLMAAGQLLALALPPTYALAYAVCFAMSLAYSVPPLRLKAVAGLDWVINIVGFGFITPLAGWAATGRPLGPLPLWIFAGFGALFAALYPLTQLYQSEEDRARGDRTLALVLGTKTSLIVALGATLAAFTCFALAAAALPAPPWGWGALALGLAIWLTLLLRWLSAHQTMTDAQHQRGMYAALGAWAATDAAVLAAFALPGAAA